MTSAGSILAQLRKLVAALESLPEETTFDLYQTDASGEISELEPIPPEPVLTLGMISDSGVIGEIGLGEYATRDAYDLVHRHNARSPGELSLQGVCIVLVQRPE